MSGFETMCECKRAQSLVLAADADGERTLCPILICHGIKSIIVCDFRPAQRFAVLDLLGSKINNRSKIRIAGVRK